MYTNVQTYYNEIFYSYYDKDKIRYDKKCKYKPTIYVPKKFSKTGEIVSKGDDGEDLISLKSSIMDYYKFIKNYGEKIPIYGNISPEYQFINEFWGNKRFDDKVLDNILIFAFDIETEMIDEINDINDASKKITSIAVKNFKNNKYYVLSTLDFDKNKVSIDIDKSLLYYKKVSNEYELLKGIVYIFEIGKPDVLTGYNIDMFDIPYLYNRIYKLLGEEYLIRMSPFKKIKDVQKRDEYSGTYIAYKDIMILSLDYYSLYIKYSTKNNEDKKLNTIAKAELNLEKIGYDGDLDSFMLDDPQKYVEYNIWDVELIHRLDKKLKMINISLNIAYLSNILFPDVLSPVKTWDSLIFNHLKNKNIQIPPKKNELKSENYRGAFVFPTIADVHKWLIIFDVKSLYPNIIISGDLGKTTILNDIPDELKQYENDWDSNIEAILNNEYDSELLKKHNVCYTPNGYFFKHNQNGYLSTIMESLFKKRISIQKKMKTSSETEKDSLNLLQRAIKYLLNAGYGVFLSQYFRYNDKRVGEAITSTGQVITKFVIKYLVENLDGIEMVAGDTDSLMISFDKYVKKNLENKSKQEIIEHLKTLSETKINDLIKKAFKIISDRLNFQRNTLSMECECIGDVGIFQAKKKYVVRKVVDEGIILEKTDLKIRGIETVKSSHPTIVRDKLKEFIEIILDGDIDKLIDELEIFRQEFFKTDVELISSISSVNHINKYHSENYIYKKGSQIYTKSALLYNELINRLNLKKKYGKIKKGDKIKYIYLKSPNPLKEDSIGFITRLPIEFGLHEYVDYKKQFEKIVIQPLNRLVLLYGVDLMDQEKNNIKNLDFLFV